jgi:hypothetical protein
MRPPLRMLANCQEELIRSDQVARPSRLAMSVKTLSI